ncbi:MAG: hypothetical protein ACRDRN_20640 [Sciscionella sp.]
MTTTLALPTTRLVAAGWIAYALDVGSSMVGLTLPQDASKWYQSGFIEVGPVVGGTPDPYVPMRKPVVSVHCWGVGGTQSAPGAPLNLSNKPPWNRTAQLAERIAAAAQSMITSGAARQVAMLAAGYAHATVHSARLLTEPREVFSDAASYAHYQFDIALLWTPQEF